MGFLLYVPFDSTLESDIELRYSPYNLRILAGITQKDDDIGFVINTVNGLVEGISPKSIQDNNFIAYDTLLTSGNIYNEYAVGNFFKVEPGDNNITFTGGIDGMKLFYNYLYF